MDRRRPGVRERLALLGPAFLVSVAYVDPGNVATNLTAGSTFGYSLVWVLVFATAMAGLVQYLSAKIGLVTGQSLPELVGNRIGRRKRLLYWLQAELVAMATDIAEVVGGAIALQLLFGLPLAVGGLITGLVSMVLLTVQDRRGQRPLERTIAGFLAVIAVGFMAGLVVAPPDAQGIAAGLWPHIEGATGLALATAMVGATLMPHVVYLHSAAVRDRFGTAGDAGRFDDSESTDRPPTIARLLAATRRDVIVAMALAGSINIGLLLLAASALPGFPGVDTIAGAHAAIESTLGGFIGLAFAVGLLASGLASTSIGCYAGVAIMDGLLQRRVPLLARRLATLVPAVIILAMGLEPTMVLVVSQIVLSFGIPFAVIPLIVLAGDARIMGRHASGRPTRLAGIGVAGVVVAMSAALILATLAAMMSA